MVDAAIANRYNAALIKAEKLKLRINLEDRSTFRIDHGLDTRTISGPLETIAEVHAWLDGYYESKH